MTRKYFGRGIIVLGLALTAACNGEAADPKTVTAVEATPVAAGADANAPAAKIGSETITMAQVDEAAAAGLFEARQAMYEARAQALDQMINERLVKEEAARRSMSEEDMLKQELQDKATPPTDAEIEAFYNENKAMMRGELAELKPRIAQHLQQEKMGARAQEFIGGLRDKAGVEIILEPPRVDVAAGDSPRWGKADAPIEIIEFSDFQCPYCTRGAETIEQVKKHYADKVTVVYRHFPLPMHDRADEGAEASECANEQGKFWEYHDQLFANQKMMSDADLKTYATNVGLDVAKFEECLASDKHVATVEQDMAEGKAVGMSGTPGFFINGRMLGGAQPFEAFQEVIDAELARLEQGS